MNRIFAKILHILHIKRVGITPKDTNSTEEHTSKIAVGGPIIGRKFNMYAQFDDIDPEELEQHVPNQQLFPLDEKKFTVLSARQVQGRIKRSKSPVLFANPMYHLDYRIYESLLKHTFIGALVDALIKYLVGSGFKPELELINPDQDPEKNKKEIEENQEIITKLLRIDNQIEANDDETLDANFKQKIISMITSTLSYNRGALFFEYEKPIEIDGKKYNTIPSHVTFAHAQDLGIIEIDPDTRRLKKVQWRLATDSMVPVKDMIYLWNPITSSKVHNSWFYGISILMPLIPSSKMIRRLLSEDFPNMAQTSWAGLFLLVVKNDKNTKESKMAEYNNVAKSLSPGKPGILIKDPEETDVHEIKFEPKITEFRELFESMIKLCISILGLPQVGFYDEAAANRSTMVGKIQLTMRTTIEPMREWIGDSIAQQWYNRWFKLLYKDKPEILEKFRIKLSWDDLHISEWYDSIEAALELDGRGQLKNTEFGEMIGLDNYESMLDPKGEIIPGGAGNKKMSMTDSETGNKFELKQKKGDR